MDGAFSGFFLTDSHIRVESDFRGVSGIVTIGETNLERRGRVAHEQATSRHVWYAVRIRMGVAEQLVLPLLEEVCGLGRGAPTGLVKASAKLRSLIKKDLAVDRPGRQRLEGLAVQTTSLDVG